MEGLMFASSLIVALLTGNVVNNSAAVNIENGLAQCVQISTSDITQLLNLTLLNADISVTQAIAYCGCKSAIASYHLYNGEQHLRSESIALKSSATYAFVLAADNSSPMPETLRLQLSCSGD